jgi:hypothetical protein
MWNRSFQEMGIPSGYGFKQLLFTPVAHALVVQTQSAEKNWRPERLYFRHIDASQYTPIGQPGDLVSQEYPFLHPDKPLIAYNCLKHQFSVDAQGDERHGADWDSLNIYNLQTGMGVEQINQETLSLPPGIARGWISTLVLVIKVCSSRRGYPRTAVGWIMSLPNLSYRSTFSIP